VFIGVHLWPNAFFSNRQHPVPQESARRAKKSNVNSKAAAKKGGILTHGIPGSPRGFDRLYCPARRANASA
jgi:hypothetical protein